MANIYVLSKDGQPLMPVHTYGRARRLLKSGRARIAAYVPFVIQLTYDIKDPVIDNCLLGIDPGRTNIGLCVIDNKANVLFASDVETRNKAIAKLMLKRKTTRQASRRGERLKRQRRAITADKTGMAKHTEFWRMLPGCKEPVCCKVIRNTEARFNNRKRPDGWLTPTADQLLRTHLNLVRKVQKLLPLSGIVIEINQFDFARMENPAIRNWECQKGRLFGFRDVYDAVHHRQEGKCLLCGKADIEHYHHLMPRHQGGSNTLDNIAGLCNGCHSKVHTDQKTKEELLSKHEGIKKKYHALSVINQIMPKLLGKCAEILPTYVTTGEETMLTRGCFALKKDHYVDAWCIAASQIEEFSEDYDIPDFKGSIHNIRQFRRHDRAIIKSQTERTYKLDGKIVAKNRKPRFEQQGPALSDLTLTKQEISRLKVTKSTRRYNIKDRLMPGAAFLHNGSHHIMSGQLTNGQYLRASRDGKTNYPTRKCKILKHNTGLVFIA